MSGILAGCGLNVESHMICGTEKWDLCYMCIIRSRQDHIIEQAHQMLKYFMHSHSLPNLLNLLPPHVLVYAAQDFTEMSMILHKLLITEMSIP